MPNNQPAKMPKTDNTFNNAATYLERLPNKKPFRWLTSLVKTITEIFYNLISNLDRDKQLVFMNYGYISYDPDYKSPELRSEDENFRYQIQMYHHLARAVDWTGAHALEVGSGRGGGASFIMRHFKPKSMTGVDLSNKAVAFCNQHYASVDGLQFVHGDAEALQFPDESFDIIINVESSLYYPNVERFFAHVVRLLKPNGHFLYVDMRYFEEIETWHKQLNATGLEILHEEDITKNAKHALSLNQEFRKRLIENYVPRFLKRLLSRFGGSDGGRLAEETPVYGKRIYKKFVFRKTQPAGSVHTSGRSPLKYKMGKVKAAMSFCFKI